MIRLNKPIRLVVTGQSTTGTDLIVAGQSPLPIGDSNVVPILLGAEISIDEACTVQMKSADTVLYENYFPGAGEDDLIGVERHGSSTHGIKVFVTGCSSSNKTIIIADVGFEYTGGQKATGG